MTDLGPFSIYIDVYHQPPEGGDFWNESSKNHTCLRRILGIKFKI